MSEITAQLRTASSRRSRSTFPKRGLMTGLINSRAALSISIVTLALVTGVAIRTPAAAQRTIEPAAGVYVYYPKTWAPSAVRYRNAFELVSRPAARNDQVPHARILITTEEWPNHEEALKRLAEIDAEADTRSAFLVIGGWPGLQRRALAPLPQAGMEEGYRVSAPLALRVTTAIAAATLLLRLEGSLVPGADPRLAADVEAIGRTVVFRSRGNPGEAEREIEHLRRSTRNAAQRDLPEQTLAHPPYLSGRGARPSTELVGAAAVQPGFGELEVAALNRLVVVATNNGFSISADRGTNYVAAGAISPRFPTGGDPSLAVGGTGNFYYAFIAFPNGTPAAKGVTGCSTGVSVATPPNLANLSVTTPANQPFQFANHAVVCPFPTAPAGICFPDQEHLAADRLNPAPAGGDQVYSVYRNFVPAAPVTTCNPLRWPMGLALVTTPSIVCSSDGGANWTNPPTAVGTGDFPRVAVGPDSFVYVVYISGSSRQSVMLRKFTSCARGLVPQGGPVTIASIPIAACPIAGLDRCSRNPGLQQSPMVAPMVAVDPTDANHIYVAFARNTAPNNDDIVVLDSADGGKTWSDAVTLNGPVIARRFMPWICTLGGSAYVSWYDRRAATPTNNDLTDYFVGSVTGHALQVGPEQNVSINPDPQCSSGWPAGALSAADFQSCSQQPQKGAVVGGGQPKYGDYNGNACSAAHVFAAWASATSPPGLPAGTGIRIFSTTIDAPTLAKDSLFMYRPGQGAAWVASPNSKGTFDALYAVGDNGAAPPNGIAGYDLLSPDDQVVAFDFDGDGKEDLFLYRPGSGAAVVARSNGDGTFSQVFPQGPGGSGIAGFDLKSISDRALAFSFGGKGKQALFLYRPGSGAAVVAQWNGTTFVPAFFQGAGGSGIAGFDLKSTEDRVLALDFGDNDNQALFLYRPGSGAAVVAQWNGTTSTFDPAFFQGAGGSGIAGFDLKSPDDRALAFGKQALLLYRPGGGAAVVAQWNGTTSTFDPAFFQGAGGSGIAGFDLKSSDDRILAFDFDGDGTQDLFLYRPGSGAAVVAKWNGTTFSPVYFQGAGGSGIAGFDLKSPDDRALAFDFDGTGNQGLLLYRPGSGAAVVARSNGNGFFIPAYFQGAGGSGIAGYDLRSPSDRVLVFHTK